MKPWLSVLISSLLCITCLSESIARPDGDLPVSALSFGSQFLAQRAAIEEKRLLQEGPVNPREYLLGSGDVLKVNVWGKASVQLQLEVDAEGRVFIPDSGSLLLAGTCLEEAKRLIESVILSTVRDGEIDVRLVSLRRFKIHVSGDVDLPGSYTASAVTRVFEVLGSGEADTLKPRLRHTSSIRNIELRRQNGEIERVDLALFYLAGDLSHNPRLSDGDVIYIPRARRFFSIGGAVMFPGTYELVEGENLSDVLRLVGGTRPEADLEKGEIRRFVTEEESESIYFNLQPVILGEDDLDIREGDRIYVRAPSHYLEQYQVYVGGEVNFPGWYAISPRQDRLSDVVARAGGFTSKADLSIGRVLRPQSLTGEGQTRVDTDMVELFVEGKTEQDILLEPGDIVEIPKTVEYVRLEGEVRRPGYVPYVPGKRASFYIRQAGGLTRKAAHGKVLVKKYSTGQSLSVRETGAVLPNDLIIVPAKVEGASWALLKDTVSLLAQVATIYLIVDQALGD